MALIEQHQEVSYERNIADVWSWDQKYAEKLSAPEFFAMQAAVLVGLDPNAAGGDSFDLSDLGLSAARFVRIRDLGTVECPMDPAIKPISGGFNLDAIAIVNAKTP